ncbi:MAG: MerR family transcriptional regulator [Armatimonadetes bacterium]|nr:MerR family transcriptional regulator [Armatimonadota bacterium]
MADDVSTEKDVIEPIEAAELLEGLKLTTGKAAQFAGVSRRQLCYWTDTGIVSSMDSDDDDDDGDSASRRTYDFDALYRVLLIKQALEQSSGLRRAARDVERYVAERRRNGDELATSIEQKREEFLTEQADHLDIIVNQIQQLLPRLKDGNHVLELFRSLDALDRAADSVQSGPVLLEEDANACLRLASLTEQAEAKLETMNSPEPPEDSAAK